MADVSSAMARVIRSPVAMLLVLPWPMLFLLQWRKHEHFSPSLGITPK